MSKRTYNNFFKAIIIWLVAVPLIVVADGFVLKYLWNWFAVPALNAREISIPIALGLSILYGSLAGSKNNKSDSDETSILVLTLTALSIRGFFLLFGYLVHLLA